MELPGGNKTRVDRVYAYIEKNWFRCVRSSTEDKVERIGLPFPYVVPCMDGMFNELFYWDTYFQNVGLICLDRWYLAKTNVDNLLHEVELLGYAPNSNLRLHLNRSQPPYLSSMVRCIYEHTHDKSWLAEAYPVLCREYAFWMANRSLGTGLNRYFHQATEQELDAFYDEIRLRIPVDGRRNLSRLEIAAHDMAEAESGWDFNPRFDRRCADYWPIDLNVNLYVYERDLSWIASVLGIAETDVWNMRMRERCHAINGYLWDDRIGLFTDFDTKNRSLSAIPSLACFQPLWAGLATKEQAASTMHALNRFEYEYGLTACVQGERSFTYQWDYPNGWAPLHYIAIEGMRRYGYHEDARRIAGKYIELVTRVYGETGRLWEKYNVVDGSIHVNDEYPMPELMDWTAGLFLYAVDYLKEVDK